MDFVLHCRVLCLWPDPTMSHGVEVLTARPLELVGCSLVGCSWSITIFVLPLVFFCRPLKGLVILR
jgi:hypothetical protein